MAISKPVEPGKERHAADEAETKDADDGYDERAHWLPPCALMAVSRYHRAPFVKETQRHVPGFPPLALIAAS
jgi:hypothetical protein